MPTVLKNVQGKRYVAYVAGRGTVADRETDTCEWSIAPEVLSRIIKRVATLEGNRDFRFIRVSDDHAWTHYLLFSTKPNYENSNSSPGHVDVFNSLKVGKIHDDRNEIIQAIDSAINGGWTVPRPPSLEPDADSLSLLCAWHDLIPEDEYCDGQFKFVNGYQKFEPALDDACKRTLNKVFRDIDLTQFATIAFL